MGGRKWTAEDLQKLEELSDRYTVAVIAKRLGRSFNAVNIKINKEGIGGFRKNTELLTFNQIAQILGVEWKTVARTWTDLGLITMRRGNYRLVRQEELLRFLQENPESWNAARVKDDAIFFGQEWYMEKRKNDRARKYHWSPEEVGKLKARYRMGASMRSISKEIGRSERAVICKVKSLRSHGFKI